MAKYRITDRRKKNPAAPPEQTSTAEFAPRISEDLPAAPKNGEAAFRLYEEFFTEGAEREPQAPLADPFAENVSAPAEEAPVRPTGDLIDPESVEPTREFNLDEVRRAFSAFEDKPAEAAEPAEAPSPAKEEEAPAADMSGIFSALFGEENVKKPAPAAEHERFESTSVFSPVGAVAPTPAPAAEAAAFTDTARVGAELSAAGLSGDTIQVPRTDLPEIKEHYFAEERAPQVTRANITDLITEATEEVSEDASDTEETSEFSRPEQADELHVALKKKGGSLWRKLIGLAVVLLLTLYLESATYGLSVSLPLPEFFTPGKFGIVYLLLDLQLLVLASAFAFGSIKNGFRTLFSGRGSADSITAVALPVALLQTLSLILFFPTAETYVLFGTVAVFLALCSTVRALLEHRANLTALKLLTESETKEAALAMGEDCAELVAFSDHLTEGALPRVFSVSKAYFASGFVRRTAEDGTISTSYTVALPIALLFSVGIAVFCYLVGEAQDAVHAINAFVAAMMMSLPAAGIFSHTLPFFFAARRGAATKTALVGEASVEEVASAEIVSFDDEEVFLPRHVKVTSVRTYGSARIDKILIYCAQIFRIVGGPLSFVFENSISSLSVPGVVEILENDGDGICARIDGKEIYVGSAAYMESYEFPVELDETDATFENTVGRIMYLAADGELAAKFYIKYAVSARFCAQLAALNRAGIYAAVKTCDPNVDAVLLQKILHNPEYPIAVIKTPSAAKNAPAPESVDAPIVGTAKISGVLNGFLLCEGVKSRAALGTLVKFVSMFLGLFITFVLAGMQDAFLSPLVCLGFQLLWLFPVVIPALFDWPTPPRRIKKKR